MISLRRPPSRMPTTPWSHPGNHLAGAERELESLARLAALPRRVELLAVAEQHADVLHGHHVAGLGGLALADDQVLHDQLGGRVPLPFGTFGLRSGFASPGGRLDLLGLRRRRLSGGGAARWESSGSASGSWRPRSLLSELLSSPQPAASSARREQDRQEERKRGAEHRHHLVSVDGSVRRAHTMTNPLDLGCRVPWGSTRTPRCDPPGEGGMRGQHRRALVDAPRAAGRIRDGDRPARDGARGRRPEPPAALAQRLLPAAARGGAHHACGPWSSGWADRSRPPRRGWSRTAS